MNNDFKTKFNCGTGYTTLILSSDEKQKMYQFATDMYLRKQQEYKTDHNRMIDRIYTGALGEYAVERLLHIRFMDLSVGNAVDYQHSDLMPAGLNVGVKTSQYGKFPVISKEETYPEIICIRTRNDNIIVCGVATTDIMRHYSSDKYIIDPKLRQKDNKTCFYGFKHLIPLNEYRFTA